MRFVFPLRPRACRLRLPFGDPTPRGMVDLFFISHTWNEVPLLRPIFVPTPPLFLLPFFVWCFVDRSTFASFASSLLFREKIGPLRPLLVCFPLPPLRRLPLCACRFFFREAFFPPLTSLVAWVFAVPSRFAEIPTNPCFAIYFADLRP